MVRWPLQPLQPLQKTQLQPPVSPSVDSLCHPWFTTTNLSYRFPMFETSATALCGTTDINIEYMYIYNYVCVMFTVWNNYEATDPFWTCPNHSDSLMPFLILPGLEEIRWNTGPAPAAELSQGMGTNPRALGSGWFIGWFDLNWKRNLWNWQRVSTPSLPFTYL